MKKHNRLTIILVFMLMFPLVINAQNITVSKYILPDGTQISPDKLDSVKKAWNGARIQYRHNDEDDRAQVMHLIKMTPEMIKEWDENTNKGEVAMQAMIGKTAPNFSLKDISGKTWTLSGLRGKVIVLNFWFNACAPCIEEMPNLNGLVDIYGNKDVIFLGITFNNQKDVTAFLKEHKFRYTLLPSSRDVDKIYHISYWPTSLVIGRDGKIKLAINSDKSIILTMSESIDRAIAEKT